MTGINVYSDEIPKFEGREVAGAAVKISGKAPLDDLHDVILEVDDRVQLRATYTVLGVNHEVNKQGQLIRVHTLKPVEMALAPFSNNDDGVLRSMPRVIGQKVDKNTGEIEAKKDPEPEDDSHIERGENKAEEPEPAPEPEPEAKDAEVEQYFVRAAELVVKLKFATVNMLQRKLDIHSISLAQKIMAELVANGIVGPPIEGRVDRDVLIDAEDLDDLMEALAAK